MKKDTTFTISFLTALSVGFLLRIYLLKDQVFADDEWHGLYYVIDKSPGWLLCHFSIPGATCIPLNFYTWALGASVGWSEIGLRLPSLICGLLCLLISPLLVKNIIGSHRTAWFALLLAICPLLIFYSRICRPYSAVAFLGFAAILFAARWSRDNDHKSAVLFVLTGTLAVYFHLFAIVTVAAPVLVAFVYHWMMRRRKMPEPVPSLKQWAIVALIIALASAILLLPALIQSLRSTFFTIALKGTIDLQSLPRAAMLISGTGQPILAALFWMALVIGAVEQCRRESRFGGMLISLYPLHALAFVLSRPDSAQSAVVLVRYSIPLVPVSLLLVACGIQTVLELIRSRITLRPTSEKFIAIAFIAALGLTGPLPQCYIAPNNFTSHGAFQHSYGRIDWNRSFHSDFIPADFPLNTVIRSEEVSPFYLMVKNTRGRPIVEYPMLIGDHFDPLYYYQHFHRRPVLIGYTRDTFLQQSLGAGNIFGNTYVDQVLTLINPSRIHFRNMVSMDNLDAMRARKVEFIVLHKHFEAQLSYVAPLPPDLNRLYHKYCDILGAPVYENANLVAFRL